MNTNLDDYRQQLLFALRARNISGERIGEAIAEVESHIAETREDPVAAFGEPAEYARRLAESLTDGKSRSPGARWINAVTAVGAFAGAALTATGLLQGQLALTAVGVVLLAALAIWLFRRRTVDRVVDPRTRTTLRMPAPRGPLIVFGVCMAVLIILAVAVR
jgi:uncharacterized membrane protein